MQTNNFDEFEVELLVTYLNHRFGEEAVDKLPLYHINRRSNLHISLNQLTKEYGTLAKERLARWFSIEPGFKGTLTTLTLHTDFTTWLQVYQLLEEKGAVYRLRRDFENGFLEPWVEQVEQQIRRNPNYKAVF